MSAAETNAGSDMDIAPVEVQVLADHHDWILNCLIDVLPKQVVSGQPFDLGGVVVLSRKAPAGLALQLEGKGRVAPVEWNQQSQLMAQRYPQSPNAAIARFRARGVEFQSDERSLILKLHGPDNQQLAVAEVLLSERPDYSRVYAEPQNRLIFDVGANDGSDTWYYLRKGFRVVAVEAIPELVANLRGRFKDQIAAGRLVVEPVAIADREGEVSFIINQNMTEWSSAHGAPKACDGSNCTITVPSTTLACLVTRHGSPYYIKIDIEGGELSAIDSLRGVADDKLPAFLSFELNPKWDDVLEHVYEMGYRRFQLVRQGALYLPQVSPPTLEGVDFRCRFTDQMSGTFGRDLPRDRWVSLVEIIRRISQCQVEAQTRKARGEKPGWFDVHAEKGNFDV
jgi:FkbM family methyltransferase